MGEESKKPKEAGSRIVVDKESGVEIEEIQGGAVTDVDEQLEIKAPHKEATARSLALALVWILGGSGALHYIMTAIFVWNDKAALAEKLGTFFNAWLPVIAGLVGSAITYYFTKGKE